jgi:hypothetical protein
VVVVVVVVVVRQSILHLLLLMVVVVLLGLPRAQCRAPVTLPAWCLWVTPPRRLVTP